MSETTQQHHHHHHHHKHHHHHHHHKKHTIRNFFQNLSRSLARAKKPKKPKQPKQKKFVIKPRVKRWILRIVKYVLGALVPTVIATLLCWEYPAYDVTVVVTIVLDVLILLWTALVLFDDVMSHKDQDYKTFYRHNFIAFAVYAVPAIAASIYMQVGGFGGQSARAKLYTFLFYNCKWLHFFSYRAATNDYGVGLIVSTLAYVAVFCLLIWAFPRLVKREKVLGKIRPKKGIRSVLWKRYYFT